jgi:hypothetical protein
MKREPSSTQLSVVRDAIDVVLGQLSTVPLSSKTDELQKRAEGVRRELDGWANTPPAVIDCERLMKVVLRLNIDVGELERVAGAKWNSSSTPFQSLVSLVILARCLQERQR